MILARHLIDRTRVAALLLGYRDRPAVDMDTPCLTLRQVSQLIVDRPEIVEIDINPLLVDADGVLALDARVRVAEPGLSRLPSQLSSLTLGAWLTCAWPSPARGASRGRPCP